MNCETCRDKRYVKAPADNAWRLYFAKMGLDHLAHNVSVPCPDCGIGVVKPAEDGQHAAP